MTAAQVEFPKDADWDWIKEKHAETAWASLPLALQKSVTLQTVRESLSGQTASLLSGHGKSNQVFLARSADGQLAGYIWVEELKSGFTGELQAYILNIYVVEEFRGQGIGAILMTHADTWARERGYKRIGLGVSARNAAAIQLYEKLGYVTETLRMFKDLDNDAGIQ